MDVRVEAATAGDHDIFWVRSIVNGREVSRSVIHVPDIPAGEKIVPEVEQILRDVYRVAYNEGAKDARKKMRDSMFD